MQKEMKFLDLHVHSRHSIACSKNAGVEAYAECAVDKGIDIVGTGDILHEGYMNECEALLSEKGRGLYEYRKVLFMLTTEVSLSYKERGRTRRVHVVTVFPDFNSARTLKKNIVKFSKFEKDGRPSVRMSIYDYYSEVMNADEESMLIPAHIWTPHFGLLGAKSGYDSLNEIENAEKMFSALETGLSSDPKMNCMIKSVSSFPLVSFSDAHSPKNLGREAVILNRGVADIGSLKKGLKDGGLIEAYLEFYPQEGKYYMSGHRKCSFSTEEEISKCPVCGKSLTQGVYNRIKSMKDREPDMDKNVFYSLPIDIIGSKLVSLKKGLKLKDSVKYINDRIPEMKLRTYAEFGEIEEKFSLEFAIFIDEMRRGKLLVEGGYDGLFGRFSTNREV